MRALKEYFKKDKTLLFVSGGIFTGVFIIVLGSQFSPTMIIALVVGIGFTLAIFYDPQIGFILSTALVVLERFGRISSDSSLFTISLMRVIGMLTLFALFVNFIVKREKIKLGPELGLYSLYTMLCFFSIFHSSDPTGAIRAFGQIIANVMFFFTVLNCTRNFKISKISLAVCLIFTVIIALYTTYDWHFGNTTVTDDTIGLPQFRWATVWIDSSEWKAGLDNIKRAIGSTSHPAVYGINMIQAIPFFFFFIQLTHSKLLKAGIIASLLVVFYNIILTNTRAVLLIAVLAVGYCFFRKLINIKPIVIVVMAVVALIFLPLFKADIFQRVLSADNYSYEKSHAMQIRIQYWGIGLQIIQRNWLLGVGVGNKMEIPKYVREKAPEQTTVHNEYIQTAMDVGIFGWLIHFGFVLIILIKGFKAEKLYMKTGQHTQEVMFLRACQASMVCTLFFGLQADVFHLPLKLWWLIAGITVMLYDFAPGLKLPALLGPKPEIEGHKLIDSGNTLIQQQTMLNRENIGV